MRNKIAALYRENPKVILTTICGLLAGACLGAEAFFRGWLG